MFLWKRLTPLYDAGEAKAIVRIILEDCFNMTLADALCGGVEALSEVQQKKLEQLMSRLEQGEPVQYVTGSTTFYGRTFHVEPGVLIPRPETEELVRWAVEVLNGLSKESQPSILDIGTGSGCIAISIAKELVNADVEAWDISNEALRIATYNADNLNAKVKFRNQDILSPPKTLSLGREGCPFFTAIISNPPYICWQERTAMQHNVLDYEPNTALFVPDNDPLLFYHAIADFAMTSLKTNGWLFFEINPLYADDISTMLMEKGFHDIEVRTDAYGKKRMIGAQR